MLRGGLRRRRFEKPKAAVDMTSLIDLTFLLLVTFIVTLPALEQGVSIILPHGKTDELPKPDQKPLSVTIDIQNRIFLNDKPVDAQELEKRLAEIAKEEPDRPVLVRGDERLEYGSVMDVVKTIYKCRIRRMSLVTVDK